MKWVGKCEVVGKCWLCWGCLEACVWQRGAGQAPLAIYFPVDFLPGCEGGMEVTLGVPVAMAAGEGCHPNGGGEVW